MNRGFTLLELIVALAVMSVALVGLYQVFSTTLAVSADVDEITQVEQTGRLALAQIVDDLASAAPVEEGSGETTPGMGGPPSFAIGDFEMGEAVLALTTASSLDFDADFPNHGLYDVRYVLEPMEGPEGEETGLYRLMRLELPYAGLTHQFEEAELELADMVVGLEIAELDAQGQAIDPELAGLDEAEPEAAGGLPERCRIVLTIRNPESGRERTLSRSVSLIRSWEGEAEQEEGA